VTLVCVWHSDRLTLWYPARLWQSMTPAEQAAAIATQRALLGDAPPGPAPAPALAGDAGAGQGGVCKSLGV
jgi:hypothetical protein